MTRKKDLSFAQARSRLLEILRDVEGDSGDVDQLAARVQEAAELIRFCNERLSAARAQVVQIVADLAAVEQGIAQGTQRAARRGDEAGGDDADATEEEDGEDPEDEEADAASSDDPEDEDDPPGRGTGRLPF